MSPIRLFSLVLAIAGALALAACGDEDGDDGKQSDGGGGEQTAVEQAARSYIVEQTADSDNSEEPARLAFADVQIDGSSAEVKATSSASGNKYEATLSKQGERWQGLTLLTDVPAEPEAGQEGDGDPNSGSGREISTDEVEQQVKSSLLKSVGVEGEVECPPKIKLRRGNNFECKVTGDQSGTVTVTQKDDEGNLNYKLSVKR